MPVLTVFFELLKSFLFLLPLPLRDWASLVAQLVKNLPAMQEIQVRFLGGKDPMEKEMATHYSSLAWRIPWTEKSGGLLSMGLQELDLT